MEDSRTPIRRLGPTGGPKPDTPELATEEYRKIVACSPCLIFIASADGQIRWTGGPVEELTGYRADEAIGRSVTDFIDLDWNPLATESIVKAIESTGLQRPMVFRVFRKDGTDFMAEVQANSQWEDPVLDGMVVFVRRCDERMLLDEIVRGMASLEPLEVVFSLLTRAIAAETLDSHGIILANLARGRFTDRYTHLDLPSPLSSDDGAPGTVVRRAVESGAPSWSRIDELAPALRDEAARRGYRWCWAWPIVARGEVLGCILVWRTHDEEPDHTCRVLLNNLATTAGLILEREEYSRILTFAAYHDPLTNLANRARFFEDLERATRAGSAGAIGVLYVDLDRFKPVNDTLGHTAGDQVLTIVATKLRHAVREQDLVARLGGDEFAIACVDVADPSVLEQMAARVIADLECPMVLGEATVRIGASVGIAHAHAERCEIDRLLEAADAALYQAKDRGRGTWVLAGTGPAAAETG